MPVAHARPFLKWAGGKSQLLPALLDRLPGEVRTGEVTRYVEPFVGGGAVFFHLNQAFAFDECHIVDANDELILAYRVVQRDVEALIDRLAAIRDEYLPLSEEERKAYFYRVRESFNRDREGIHFDRYSRTWVRRAAQLVFLNRTCFNGLFRVNAEGAFNVPFGRQKNPTIVNEALLRADAAALEKTRIHRGDFTIAEPFIDDRTFVYFDPPYRPLSSTSSFTAYARRGFTDADQHRLAAFFRDCHRKGAFCMLSNSDPRNGDPGDQFFDTLYAGFAIERVPAKRMINSNGAARGEITEIIVDTYRMDR
ncbi:MAG: DNA adenine methylase [Methanomicrobiales archaeon]